MSDANEEIVKAAKDVDATAKAISYAIEAAKLGGVLVALYLGMSKVQTDAAEERHIMQVKMEQQAVDHAELKGETKSLAVQVQANTVLMGKFEERLINIKDDTEQTLELVRDYVRDRN